MAGKVSPGIYTNELVYNEYVQLLSTTRPAIVGGASKGPTNTPTVCTSPADLISKFGQPLANDYGLLSAIEFMREGAEVLYLRVANGDAAADATILGGSGRVAETLATGSIELTGTPTNGDTVTVQDRATYATGSVIFSANPVDGDRITIGDGVISKTFEFDSNAGVTGGNISVTIGATAAITATNLVTAINNTASFNVTAASTASTTVSLVNDSTGATGNVAITKVDANFAFTVSGMTGGAASSNVKIYEFDAAIAATGSITFTGAPSDSQSFVISDGANAYTFEFDTNNSVTQTTYVRKVDVSGANNDGARATALANAINGSTIGITAAVASNVVNLTNDTGGIAGNVTITGTVTNAVASGMSGGVASGTVGSTGGNNHIAVSIGSDATTAALALRNAINAQKNAGNSTVSAATEVGAANPTIRLTAGAGSGSAGNTTVSKNGTNITVASMTGGISATAGSPAAAVRFYAATSGSWGNDVTVQVIHPSADIDAGIEEYDLVVSAPVDNAGTVQVVERFKRLSNDPNSTRFAETILSDGVRGEVYASEYIRADQIATHAPYPATYTLGTVSQNVTAVVVGADGVSSLASGDYIGTVNGATATGLKSLRDSEQSEFNLLVVPGISHKDVVAEMLSVCEYRGDAFAIIDPPYGILRDDVIAWHNGEAFNIADSPLAPLTSNFGAVYWPWFQQRSDYLDQNVWLPPSAAALQAFGKTDREVGQWRAAMGHKYGTFSGLKLEFNPRREDRDELVGGSNRVNPIASFQSSGLVVFGNRTLQRVAGPLDSVHVKRMVLFLKKSIATAAQYLVGDPNDSKTWRDFEQTVEPILTTVAAGRGLESFRVKCDEETNPPQQRAQKTMRGIVYLKHIDAAEVIVVDFALQSTGQTEFTV